MIQDKLIRGGVVIALITILTGLVYITLQQYYRRTANNPQQKIATDLAQAITQGLSPQAAIPVTTTPVDIAHSSDSFSILYSVHGDPLNTSGVLNGKTPVPPVGVFDKVRKKGINRFTWEPQPGLRLATVITSYTGDQQGFVLSARSLSDTEKKQTELAQIVILTWLSMVIVAGVGLVLF